MALAKNIPSPSYMANLDFSYLETYSLQRGVAYENRLSNLLADRKKLKIAYGGRWNEDIFNQQLSAIEQQINAQYLIDGKGQLHWSAQLIHTFNQQDAFADKLSNILLTAIKEIPLWMCAPVYRDGIVFYDKAGKILSCLNICFGCDYMSDGDVFIDADVSAYINLKKLFLQVGHPINAPVSKKGRFI